MVLHTIISEYDILFADTWKDAYSGKPDETGAEQCYFSTDPYAYLNSDNRKAGFK